MTITTPSGTANIFIVVFKYAQYPEVLACRMSSNVLTIYKIINAIGGDATAEGNTITFSNTYLQGYIMSDQKLSLSYS